MIENETSTRLAAQICAEIEGVRGQELVQRLARLLARQQSRIEALETSLRMLSTYERHHGPLIATEEPVRVLNQKLSTRYQLLASDYLLQRDGFHTVEFSGNGSPYRWCAPKGVLSFSFFIDRTGPIRVELVLFNTVDERNYKDITVVEGDVTVPLTANRIDGKPDVRFETVLPPRPEMRETRLRFQMPVSRQLSQADRRVASVAFHSFAAAPVEELPDTKDTLG